MASIKGPRKIHRNSAEFKLKAVELSVKREARQELT
jgi:hypothetical protein